MKKLIRLSLASLTLLPVIGFAAEPQCPSIDTIHNNVVFDNAFSFGDWIGYTTIEGKDGNEWTVEGSLIDSADQSKEDFIVQANKLIKTVKLNGPMINKNGKYTECYYNYGPGNSFSVAAINPPPIPLKAPFK